MILHPIDDQFRFVATDYQLMRAAAAMALLVLGACQPPPRERSRPPFTPPPRLATRFVAIGDYGYSGAYERAVADLVTSLGPDFIITLGDNNYVDGSAAWIDANIGQYFHSFIAPYRGTYGSGATENRFFPSLGNHDWDTPGAQPYLDYFELAGNERYYDFVRGPVHFFALDSDVREPDGNTVDSPQAAWLQAALTASTARWRIVYMHHPPYSSGPHGSTPEMQWPFAQWGASLVLAGHDHVYERLVREGLTYVVNGVGGAELYPITSPIEGSLAHQTRDNGAVSIDVDDSQLHLRFYNVGS